jgi:hypothetical protein
MIRKLLSLAAAVLLVVPAALIPTAAEAQARVPVRFFYVLTLGAKLRLQQMGITAAQLGSTEGAKLNAAFVTSQMQTRAEYAGSNDQGIICCGGDVGDTASIVTDSVTKQSALAWASNSPAVHKAREAAWADVVVVVTDDPLLQDAAGFNYNDCAAPDRSAKKSIIGITIQAIAQGTHMHEAGHTMCAGHDKDNPNDPGTNHGHYWVTGVPGNCIIHGTIMSRPKAVTATVVNWTVNENGLVITPGQGPTADQANIVMTGNCPQASGYRCTVVGSCQILNPASAQCSHYRIPPTGSPQLITSFGTSVTNTFTCPETSWVREQLFSNPAVPLGGVISGTGTANNAAAIDAGSLVTQTYRNVNVSKKLITASQ